MILLSRRAVCGMLPLAASALTMGTRVAKADDFKVVFYNGFSPVSVDNDAHQITGILPDMMTEILGNRMKMPVALQGMPWARAQASVQDGSADAFCTAVTPARLEYVSFTKNPVIVLKNKLFYLADNPRKADIETIKTVDQLKGFRQGDYVGNGFAEATFKGLPVEYVPTLESVFKKIEAGRTDIFVGTDIVAQGMVKQLGLTDKIKSFDVDIGVPQPFCIGIRKTYPDVAAVVARADDAIMTAQKEGALDKIASKYLA